jgi:hypothetical protein
MPVGVPFALLGGQGLGWFLGAMLTVPKLEEVRDALPAFSDEMRQSGCTEGCDSNSRSRGSTWSGSTLVSNNACMSIPFDFSQLNQLLMSVYLVIIN